MRIRDDLRVNILRQFSPDNWYWHITEGKHRADVSGTPVRNEVYSSARGAYVPVTDPAYVAWRMATMPVDRTTEIDTEEELIRALAGRGIVFGVPGG